MHSRNTLCAAWRRRRARPHKPTHLFLAGKPFFVELLQEWERDGIGRP
jgi:hypothetical protein